MRKLFYLALIMLICSYISVHAATLEGGVSTDRIKTEPVKNQIFDSATNLPVPYAKVILPKENYTTYTDANGYFKLDTKVKNNSILAVEKEGYRPFSLTLNSNSTLNPIKLNIDKSKPLDIVIDSDICHLGDNAYSDTSANSSEFRLSSNGSSYSKSFNIQKISPNQNIYLLIGSIIGLDTKLAQKVGQNRIKTAYSSPAEVYVNGTKISELHLNGDNQRIKIPSRYVNNGKNELTIKTGHNLMEMTYIDYDDIEFMNLSVVTE